MDTFFADLLALVTSSFADFADDAAPILLVLIGVNVALIAAFAGWKLLRKGGSKAV
jgi:hypothetical protein